MKNLFVDFYNFCLVIVYWPFAFIILIPIKYIDRLVGTHIFIFLDKLIRKIANL